MIRALVEQTFDATKKYFVLAGLSTDSKPTTGIVTGSKFIEVDTGVNYAFDEVGGTWSASTITEQEIKDEIDSWLEDNIDPDSGYALDRTLSLSNAAAPADMVGDLKSAITNIDVDISAYNTAFAVAGNGTWTNITSRAGYNFPVSSGDIIELKKNAAKVYYAILTDIDGVSQGASVHFATGCSLQSFDHNNVVTVTVPSDGHYIWVYHIDASAVDHMPAFIKVNTYDILKAVKGNIISTNESMAQAKSDLSNDITSVDGRITENENTKQASGDMETYAVSADGINEETVKESVFRDYNGQMVVGVNHDDMMPSDYLNTRKTYNKYGFRANFNLVVKPFTTAAYETAMRENVQKMVQDGNDIGLHAVFDESFWWMNKLYDMRPNYAFTYAPTLTQVTTDVGSGKNVFGYTVDSTKKMSELGFHSVPEGYDKTVAEMNATTYMTLISAYSWYNATDTRRFTGRDIGGTSRTWTFIHWLEHWYNELIDNTLGYSSEASLATKYATDYSVPSGATVEDYYPDAAHLANGKIVRHDDTTNPNYSDSDYQKVGYFVNGLFKGHSTCCNYEVRDRVIKIAKAWAKHYLGIDNFTVYGRHGVEYVDMQWVSNGVPYDNSDMTIYSGEAGKVFNTETMQFETGYEILLRNGIKMANHYTPLAPVYEGVAGIYYGQRGNRMPFFNSADAITYLGAMGNAALYDGTTTTYADFMKIMGDVPQKDWVKYIYEKAGTSITKNSVTKYIYVYLKNLIDTIRGSIGTGKIPTLSLDTIINDASNNAAVEMLCKYCYDNDIKIVPMEKARIIAQGNREALNNYFPNPSFSQSLINYFGGSSESNEAYIPDGWRKYNANSNTTWSVAKENGKRKLTITSSGSGYAYIITKIYGLPAGNYKLTFTAKKTGNVGRVIVAKNLNATRYGVFNTIQTVELTTTETEYEVTFTVEEPYCGIIGESAASQYNQGYENNVSNISIQLGMSLDNSGTQSVVFHSPKLVMV